MTGSSGQALKLISPSTQVIVGFAIKISLPSVRNLVRIYADNGTRLHLTLSWNTDGSLSVARSGGGTLASTPAGSIPYDTWGHVEFRAILADGTSGEVEVRINGISVINFTGDTRNAGTSANIDGIMIGDSSNMWYDDLYICDSTGPAPYNTFLGDIRINTITPTGAGSTTQFTPYSGANYENVDELPYSASDYVTSSLSGSRDTYAMGDITGDYTILGVQNNVIARKSDAGGTGIRSAIVSGGNTYYGSGQTLTINDTTTSDIRTVDPATGIGWTMSGVNNLESGMEIV